jgi:hypothetical protein
MVHGLLTVDLQGVQSVPANMDSIAPMGQI